MAVQNQTAPGHRNADPITGEPGAHPVGVGVGTAGGAATGAAIGAVGGPVGAVIGAIAGGIAGGLAGKEVAEAIDPTVEDQYWRQNYHNRPYANKDAAYDDYGPAYRYGWEARSKMADRKYDDVEADLERGWENARSSSRIGWHEARPAVRDAWDRVDNRTPRVP